MGEKQHMRARFTKEGWEAIKDDGSTLHIGKAEGAFRPYDLLLAALEGCLYATIVSVAEKMQADYDILEMEVSGEKRDEKVATLKECHIAITVTGASDEKKITKACDIGTRYCSVYNTIAKVAEMSWDVTFQ